MCISGSFSRAGLFPSIMYRRSDSGEILNYKDMSEFLKLRRCFSRWIEKRWIDGQPVPDPTRSDKPEPECNRCA